MRPVLLFVLLCTSFLILSAQSSRYETNYMMRIFPYNVQGNGPVFLSVSTTGSGWDFDVVSSKQSYTINTDMPNLGLKEGDIFEYYLIEFPEWRGGDDNAKNNALNKLYVRDTIMQIDFFGNETKQMVLDAAGQPIVEKKIWCLAASDLTPENVTEVHRLNWWPSPEVGTVVFPVKLRMPCKKDTVGSSMSITSDSSGSDTSYTAITRAFDFASDVTLGTSFGLKWRISRRKDRFVTAFFGAGISEVTIDSTTTNGFITQESLNASAFTLSMGLAYQFEVGQVGIAMGWDMLNSAPAKTWHYQGKPWIGVGLGVQVFSQQVGSERHDGGKQGPN